MNKKRIIVTSVMFLIAGAILSLQAYAQSPTVKEVTPTKASALDKEVQNLKEKIADKVSELKKGGTVIAGTINSIGKDTIEITGEANKVYKIAIDDTVTSFNQIKGTSKAEIELSDLEKGDYIFVSGPLVESTVTANGIYKDTPYIVGSGQITAVDTDAVSMDIVSTDKTELTIDISGKIKPKIMDSKTLEIERTTLAKIKAGDTIHYVVTSTDDEKTVSAVSLLVIPQEYFSN
ncbi:MAG: hypothetical protein WBO77_00490 [Microgenomates group bacterium]